MKNHQNHFLGIQNIIGSPNFSHQNHWISIIWDGQDSQDHPKNFISRTIPSACDSGSSERSAWRSSQNLGFGQGVPPTEWSECLLLYIYIYYIHKFERISHNKQVLDGLGDAAAHVSTNWMTLYFSQDLQSADQFSEAKQTQPVHLQHHPACHSSML